MQHHWALKYVSHRLNFGIHLPLIVTATEKQSHTVISISSFPGYSIMCNTIIVHVLVVSTENICSIYQMVGHYFISQLRTLPGQAEAAEWRGAGWSICGTNHRGEAQLPRDQALRWARSLHACCYMRSSTSEQTLHANLACKEITHYSEQDPCMYGARHALFTPMKLYSHAIANCKCRCPAVSRVTSLSSHSSLVFIVFILSFFARVCFGLLSLCQWGMEGAGGAAAAGLRAWPFSWCHYQPQGNGRQACSSLMKLLISLIPAPLGRSRYEASC